MYNNKMEEKPESLGNKILIGTSLMVLFGFIVAENSYERPVVKVYDCAIAEYAPDIPVPVKEECRKLRSLKI